MSELYCMHLKRDDCEIREKLFEYCISNGVLGFGWCFLYSQYGDDAKKPEGEYKIESIDDFIEAARDYYINREKKKTLNHSFDCFKGLEVDDLVWTRDPKGLYYLCRIIEKPKSFFDMELDIGAVVKADFVKIDTSVPGVIVHRFSTSRSPTIQRIANEYRDNMLNYSKSLYNEKTGTAYYKVNKVKYDLFSLLSGFDLEELVIDYLQIKYDYYLSKNSIAFRDTTVSIECELFSKKPGECPIVVQVKGGKEGSPEITQGLQSFVNNGKKVFLFFTNENYGVLPYGFTSISKSELYNFAVQQKDMLPESIREWIDLSI